MYQIALNRNVSELAIPYGDASTNLSLNIIRQGEENINAMMDKFTVKNGLAKFRTNTDVHMLPVGLYTGVLMDGDCVCCEYPVKIDGCTAGLPAVNEGVCDTEELDSRPCIIEDQCEETPCEIKTPCELYRYECGNKVGENKNNFPIEATARKKSNAS